MAKNPRIMVSEFFNDGYGTISGFTMDKRMVAKRGPKGTYAIDHDTYDSISDGPGMTHAFGPLRTLADFWNCYEGYTLTLQEAVEKLKDFERTNISHPSLLMPNAPDRKHYSNFVRQ